VRLVKRLPSAGAVLACGAWLVVGQPDRTQPSSPARYDVVWTTASHDASGSMPIGNGEVGLNVWVEEGGLVDLRVTPSERRKDVTVWAR
jgi:hypothetical protein